MRERYGLVVISIVVLLMIFPLISDKDAGLPVEAQKENPFNIIYSEPDYVFDMIVDSRNDTAFFAFKDGLLQKDMNTGDYFVISGYEGLDRNGVLDFEIDWINYRLFLSTGSKSVFEYDIRSRQIIYEYNFTSMGVTLRNNIILNRELFFVSQMNLLCVADNFGISILNLTDFTHVHYDFVDFGVELSEFVRIKDSVTVETKDYFSINALDFNPKNNDLYIATNQGLSIMNLDDREIMNYRDGSKLNGEVWDVLYIEERNSLYLSMDNLTILNLMNDEIIDHGFHSELTGKKYHPYSISHYPEDDLIYVSSHEDGKFGFFDLKTDTVKGYRYGHNDISDHIEKWHKYFRVLFGNYPIHYYDYFTQRMYVAAGRLTKISHKWSVRATIEYKENEKIEWNDFEELPSNEPIHISSSIEYAYSYSSRGGHIGNNTVCYSFDYETEEYEKIELTGIPRISDVTSFSEGYRRGMTYNRELDTLMVSGEDWLLFLNDELEVVQRIRTNDDNGRPQKEFDFYFQDSFSYNDKIFFSERLIFESINGSFVGRNLEFSQNFGGKLRIGERTGNYYFLGENITITDPEGNINKTIYSGFFTSNIFDDRSYYDYIDPGEEFILMGSGIDCFKINIENGTVEEFEFDELGHGSRGRSTEIDNIFHRKDDEFIAHMDGNIGSTNENLGNSLPDHRTITYMHYNQELDQIYAITGRWGLGGATGIIVRGLIIYDLKTMEWDIVSGNHGLPDFDQYHQLSFDPDNGRIFIKGDNFIASIDLDDIDGNDTGREIPIVNFQEKDLFGPMTYMGFQWGMKETSFSVFSIIMLIISMVVFVFEPAKSKLFTIIPIRLFTKLKVDDLHSHETRSEILSLINERPGIHYSGLKKELGLNNGTLSYHLKVLERVGLIKSRNFGVYKLFFNDAYSIPENFRKLTRFQREILATIHSKPGVTQKQLSEKFQKKVAVISYQLNKMISFDMIETKKDSGKKRYFVKANSLGLSS